jgi:hypothetical protein
MCESYTYTIELGDGTVTMLINFFWNTRINLFSNILDLRFAEKIDSDFILKELLQPFFIYYTNHGEVNFFRQERDLMIEYCTLKLSLKSIS